MACEIGVLKEAFGSDADPDAAPVNTVVRAAIDAMRTAGAVMVDISLPDVMDHVIETSLYLTHSRHDINAFLAARPGSCLWLDRRHQGGWQVSSGAGPV